VHPTGSKDSVGSSIPSGSRLGRQLRDESRTECLGLRAFPESGEVEASRAEPVLSLANREQIPVVHLCLDNVHLYRRLRGYRLTRICILDMSLNRALSSYIYIAD
jgi:hypothetical protein